jgi:hypothetical protein
MARNHGGDERLFAHAMPYTAASIVTAANTDL